MIDNPSILVVDDEADSRSLLKGILVSEGYHVRTADSGRLALASVDAWLPELILLDIRMQGMDGFKVCRRLKAADKSRRVPVIFITAANDVQERVTGLAVGAVDYISKPFQREELLARVRTHLELTRLRENLERQVLDRTTDLRDAVDQLRESEQHLVSIYNTVRDVIFHLAVEPEGRFRFVSVNAAFLRVTGLSRAAVIGKTVNEAIPEPSLTMVLGKCRQAIEENTTVVWEETSDYPTGRLTGQVSVAPVFDNTGTCTHLVGSVHDITEIKRAKEIEKRLASDLAVSRDEIRALAAGLMKAQEDERRRISRELHDHICHQLASLAIEIGKLAVGPLPPPSDARAQLEALRTRVVKTSQEAHDIAYQMHTVILDDLGLVASLKHMCREFSEQYPQIALGFQDSGKAGSIPRESAYCLHRVAQESLQNIAKHSRAQNVSVRLGFKKGVVVLTIQDDGVGMDPKAVKGNGRLGLISMKERALSVNGKLTITSQQGHGTQISLEVPLPVDNL